LAKAEIPDLKKKVTFNAPFIFSAFWTIKIEKKPVPKNNRFLLISLTAA
jgi:hypothetical protein